MESRELFEKLVQAETEEAVEAILSNAGYLMNEAMWRPLGDIENNFAAVGNQQTDPAGALIEKIINGIDAVLMAKAFERGVAPESPDAPETMAAAVEQFFGVQDGRLSYLDRSSRQQLADNIHLVAVGSKMNPNYLVIDRGEGQTPARFPETFLSIMKSNKMRIPFVQGKFNSGGLGILQFCGDNNYQLIASRRHPNAPVNSNDVTANLWGFTLVRRLRPADGRRSSVYVYLAPGGAVPSFAASGIKVLPGPDRRNHPCDPYAIELNFGTCIKLYNFRWRARTIITLDARYELERLLHSPALPFRLEETRNYTANAYHTTVSGGWHSATTGEESGESVKLEDGFPAYAELVLPDIGRLPYQIAVYEEGTKKRHVPFGVFFVVNGQVHGSLPSNFVTKNLKFAYLDDRGPLLVSVDCTAMDARTREDFFMASRDRVRRNEVYAKIEERLSEELRNHPGLQAINQRRRQKEMERPLDEDASLGAFQRLLDTDPSLASLFAAGERLVTTTGPVERPPFVGRQFPTFFRIAREPRGGLIKPCPVNHTCRVEFETDAVNDYFERLDSSGTVTIDPTNLIEHNRLWNGRWETRFTVPWDAKPGDTVTVTVSVSDVEREATNQPFVSTFTLQATPPVDEVPNPPGRPNPPGGAKPDGKRTGVSLSLPRIREVHKAEWAQYEPAFNTYEALRIKPDGEGGYDYHVNVDNAFLLTELDRAKDGVKKEVRFRFIYGLVIAAVGMIKHSLVYASTEAGDTMDDGSADETEIDELEQISRACNGFARVVVPLIGTLSQDIVVEE